MIKEVIARHVRQTPEQLAEILFKAKLPQDTCIDALYMDSSFSSIVAISGLPFRAPVVIELLKNREILADILAVAQDKHSILVDFDGEKAVWRLIREDGAAFDLSPASREAVSAIVGESAQWAGCLNQAGEHEIDLRTPSPGPHFSVNLLIGNRIGFPHALQTTPKSVVDRLGGGSFRSHAATQVLATRWDMRQEENGHPANRQFYIIEGNQQVFYSANPLDANIIEARCIHSQNHTTIIYKTRCGLEIKRLIFILPQKQNMPLAVETQRIEVINHTGRERHLRLVYTGMFGNFMPIYQMEDILFTNIIMQSRLLLNEDASVLAIGPDYSTLEYKTDQWFHVMLESSWIRL